MIAMRGDVIDAVYQVIVFGASKHGISERVIHRSEDIRAIQMDDDYVAILHDDGKILLWKKHDKFTNSRGDPIIVVQLNPQDVTKHVPVSGVNAYTQPLHFDGLFACGNGKFLVASSVAIHQPNIGVCRGTVLMLVNVTRNEVEWAHVLNQAQIHRVCSSHLVRSSSFLVSLADNDEDTLHCQYAYHGGQTFASLYFHVNSRFRGYRGRSFTQR